MGFSCFCARLQFILNEFVQRCPFRGFACGIHFLVVCSFSFVSTPFLHPHIFLVKIMMEKKKPPARSVCGCAGGLCELLRGPEDVEDFDTPIRPLEGVIEDA